MTHKDWKGPGWYNIWTENGKYFGVSELLRIHPNDTWTYKKLESFIPPKHPEWKLEDGLYVFRDVASGDIVFDVKLGNWRGNQYFQKNPILGRVPLEPVKESE